MSRFLQGEYRPQNPQKYVGRGFPRYRSGWEFAFFTFCDQNQSVLEWASEAISIPYRNPITGQSTRYVPDIFMRYRTKKNRICSEIIEIKPRRQTVIEGRMSERDRMVVAINHAKWQAARAWCQQQGLVFRVLDETQLFRKPPGRR